MMAFDDRVRPVPRPPAEDLVADGGEDRDEDDPAHDIDQRILLADQGEGDDREGDDDDQELGSAARMGGRVAPDVLGRQRIAGLERVDRHVLGAVVLEDALDVRRSGDHEEVAEEEGDLGEALDEVGDPGAAVVGEDEGEQEGRHEEDTDPDERDDAEHERDRAPPDLLAVLLGLDVGAPDEPARPDHERLVQDDETTDQGRGREPRIRGARGRARSAAHTIRPSGCRKATAIAFRPRMRTPSMSACPP